MNENRIPNFTGDTNPFMPCLDANGNYKKVFKESIKPRYSKSKDLSKLGSYIPASNAMYMHVIPNSHYWGDLNGILNCLNFYYESERRKKLPKKPNVYYGESEMSKEYLLIGLNNAKKHGYKLKFLNDGTFKQVPYMFGNIDAMIIYVENHSFESMSDYKDFEQTIKYTLEYGINLTNGLKMERNDVYRRIDGERDYQDATWSIRREVQGTPDDEKPVAEWINYMEYHINKAKERVYHLDTESALAEVRKVAALAVRTMEIHGCPERIIKNDCSDGKIE
jgi:hypothetical protein